MLITKLDSGLKTVIRCFLADMQLGSISKRRAVAVANYHVECVVSQMLGTI